MLRRLYDIIDGSPRLCDGVDYWKEMFNLQVDERCYINPFAHLIKCEMVYDDLIISIRPSSGSLYIVIRRDDEFISEDNFYSFYDFYIFQINFWNTYGISLIQLLKHYSIIGDDSIDDYCSILFFPPILKDRTEWDYTIPDEEFNTLGVYDREKNPGGWTDVIYNEDGTFTHSPTPIAEIPVDPKNVEAVKLKQRLLTQNK